MILAIPHPLEHIECFLRALANFKNSNKSFRLLKFVLGLPFFRRWKIETNYIYPALPPFNIIE
jgi:hypothetical protein